VKFLKYALAAAGALVFVAAALIAYVALTFDVRDYEPRIIAFVKEKTGRTLVLEGRLGLSFWPSIGATLGRTSLSEPNSERPFASMESARVSLKVLPLLAHEFVVDELTIKGLRAHVVRTRAGTTNADDLLGKKDEQKPEESKPKQGVAFDVAHVALDDATIDYTDAASGKHYALSGLTLKTGRLAPGVPTNVELTTAARSTKPAFDLTLHAKTRLTFDLEQRAYAVDGLALDVKGQAAGYTNLALKATGSASASLAKNEFTADKLSVTGSGQQGKSKVEFKLDAPRLAMTAERASGEKIALAYTTTGPEGSTALNATLPGIEGNAKSFRSPAMTLDLERKQPDRTVKAHVVSPLTGSVEAKQVSLPQLKADIAVSGAKTPSVSGALAGSASIDGAKERAQANLAGKVADSNVKARVNVAGFKPLGLDFDVDMDQLDLPRLSGKPAAPAKSGEPAPKAPPAKTDDKPIDLSALRDLRAKGALRIGNLKTSTIAASDVRVNLQANGGRVNLSPLSATLYQGRLAGSVGIDASQATPAFAVKQTLNGVQVGPLLRDLSQTDALEGLGNVSVDVTARGNTTSALKKALNGKAAVKITNGAVKGIDIAGTIRKGQALLGAAKGEQVQQSDAQQKTDFSELTATFDIRNGVAHNNDLDIKSPLLRIGGAGSVNIAEDTVDYTVKASVVATTAGQGGKELADLRGVTVPVHVSGPIAKPSYKVDLNAMVTDTARRKVEDALKKKLEERLGGGKPASGGQPSNGDQARKALEDKLKGLFGR
jgi:AsmA protein